MKELGNAEYPSVWEFVQDSLGPCRNETNQSQWDRTENGTDGGKKWLGGDCANAAQVRDKMERGYKKGQLRVSELLQQIDTTLLVPQDLRRRIHRADMGDTLDISAVYAGRHLTAWTRAKRMNGLAPQRIDILANMLISCVESADILFWRGAAAIALADALESAGYMTRLVYGFGSDSVYSDNESERRCSCRVTVKDHDKPLDLSTVSAMTLPGTLRAVGIQWVLRHAHGYLSGGVMSADSSQLPNLDMDSPEIMVRRSVTDKHSAMRWLAETIKEVNERYAPLAA